MRRGQITISCLLLLAVVSGGLLSLVGPQDSVNPETLHPQRSILYFVWDGSAAHQEALQQTAQYKALVESGLLDYGVGLFQQSIGALSAQQSAISADELQMLDPAKHYLTSLYQNGISFSATDGTDDGLAPMATLVLHQSAEAIELVPVLLPLLGVNDQPDRRTLHGRDIFFLRNPRNPSIELTWWTEGPHLVVAIGVEPAERTIALATGNAPNVTSHPLWKKCRAGEQPFEVAATGWLRLADLRERYGRMPVPIPDLPEQVTVNDLLEIAGLQNLNSISGQFGYRGPACISRSIIDAPGPRTGLLALMDQPLFTLDDLPPLPPDSLAFAATSMNAARSYDTVLELGMKIADLLEADGSLQVRQMEEALPGLIGIDVRDDLLQSLGSIHCFYSDPAGGPFGMGFGYAASVRDSQRLTGAVNVLADQIGQMLQREELPFATRWQRKTVNGRSYLTLPLGGVAPTIGIGDNWLSIGLFPQTAHAFFLRQDGQLERWQPSEEHQTALAELPDRFSTISVNDPRAGLRALYSFVPMINSGVHSMVPAAGPGAVQAIDLPPQELVLRPLFPNISVSVPGEAGVEVISRSSVPGLPAPSAQSAVVLPVMVALLLPAVQQARQAARRTASSNNLKQIGLALHNFHEVYAHFPSATEAGTDLKPTQRLSFYFALLPFIEQSALYEAIEDQRKQAWDSQQNQPFTSMTIPTLQNPGSPGIAPATTHYLGIAGVGEDAADLPIRHERAGIFGHDRKTRIQDIADGIANTAMVTETWKDEVPWAAGGQTLISLTQEPYINGPDGMGGPYPGGCNVLMADGSVRFISELTDAAVLRAIATMAGGEVVRDLP